MKTRQPEENTHDRERESDREIERVLVRNDDQINGDICGRA